MSECTNCFSGCVEITSDKCIKYTGLDIPSLGIENGDPLSEVTLAITNFLSTVLDGTGIIPSLEEGVLCSVVNSYLPEGDLTLSARLSAIVQTACFLQSSVTSAQAELDSLNSAYVTGCLTGIVDNTDTHEVLNAVIDKLCDMDLVIQQLIADLPSTYVALADLNALVDAHLGSSTTLQYTKMVPYTAVEFWGDPAGKFDVSGAGIGDWINIYLCNGNNGTPDKRGRVTVCATNNMGGGAYNAAVDPAISGNPTYSLNTVQGANNVSLNNINQLPAHTHTATPNLVLADHFHYMVGSAGNSKVLTAAYPIKYDELGSENENYRLAGTDAAAGATIGKTSSTKSAITSNTVSIATTGSSASHSNIQPVIAAYYIIYLP